MTDKQNYFTYTDNTSDNNDKIMENLHKQNFGKDIDVPNKTIIDGVDVSGCEYFKINRGFNCYKGHNCTDKECRDCYYKNWQRKEQELKQYKRSKQASYEAIQTKCNELELKNRRLKQTLNEIKEIAEKEVHTRMLFADKKSFCDFDTILQKISECEVNNER